MSAGLRGFRLQRPRRCTCCASVVAAASASLAAVTHGMQRCFPGPLFRSWFLLNEAAGLASPQAAQVWSSPAAPASDDAPPPPPPPPAAAAAVLAAARSCSSFSAAATQVLHLSGASLSFRWRSSAFLENSWPVSRLRRHTLVHGGGGGQRSVESRGGRLSGVWRRRRPAAECV